MDRTDAINPSSLKVRKEDWVSGHNGTTFLEFITVLVSPSCWYAAYFCISSLLHKRGIRLDWKVSFCVEYIMIIVPALIIMSETPFLPYLFVTPLLFVFLYIVFNFPTGSDVPLICNEMNSRRKPFLVFQRGQLIIMTLIAILAVDFPIFPRRFCKAEVIGWSVMDIGVGCFIFTNGCVYYPKISRMGKASVLGRVKNMLHTSLPLIVIGFIRTWSTRAVDYQLHVTEYGVHWNFFFTIGVVQFFALLLDIPPKKSVAAAIVVAIVHQILLRVALEDYLLNAPRTSLISMNKEGIVSCTGYFAIYLIGIQTGSLFFAKHDKISGWWLTWLKTTRNCIIIGSVLAISCFYVGVPSRRLMNVPYIALTVFMNTFQISFMVFAFMSIDHANSVLLRGFNRNSLFMFLLGNVLTGVCNFSMTTIDASPLVSVLVMNAYMLILCLVAVVLDRLEIQIRLSFK